MVTVISVSDIRYSSDTTTRSLSTDDDLASPDLPGQETQPLTPTSPPSDPSETDSGYPIFDAVSTMDRSTQVNFPVVVGSTVEHWKRAIRRHNTSADINAPVSHAANTWVQYKSSPRPKSLNMSTEMYQKSKISYHSDPLSIARIPYSTNDLTSAALLNRSSVILDKGNLDRNIVRGNLERSFDKGNLDRSFDKGNLDRSFDKINLDRSFDKSNLDRSFDKSVVERNLDKSNIERNFDRSSRIDMGRTVLTPFGVLTPLKGSNPLTGSNLLTASNPLGGSTLKGSTPLKIPTPPIGCYLQPPPRILMDSTSSSVKSCSYKCTCDEDEEKKRKSHTTTPEGLSWRRLHMSRAKLKATATTSELLSGFAMVAMVELQINEPTSVPEWLFVMFAVCTTVLVAVHIFALMISTYILPNIDAISKLDICELVAESPHERMRGFIELAWAFSTILGLFLFLVEVAILCWVKFWDYSFTAAIAATVVVIPVLVIFVLFAMHFYHSLVVHRCDTSVTDMEKLENMKKQLDQVSTSPV